MKNKEDSQKSRENTVSFYSKLSNKEKELFRESANLLLPEKKALTFDDLIKFEKAKESLLPLKEKKALTFDDLIKFEKAKESLLPLKEKYKVSLDELFTFVKAQLFLPITIFKNKLTVLESAVKYLKDEEKLSLHKISDVIGRDQRNIWHIYNKASKKYPEQFVISKVKFWIPASIFSNTELSALEAIVSYIKDEFSLNYHEIALLLKRDDRTIWTVYQRANKKNVKSK